MNINNLVRENIKNLKPYSSARDEFKELNADMVFLRKGNVCAQLSVKRRSVIQCYDSRDRKTTQSKNFTKYIIKELQNEKNNI